MNRRGRQGVGHASTRRTQEALGLDPEVTAVEGGTIVRAHPLAASGARITIHHAP
ncbi:MAG: hypothetical protein LJF06_09025 [Gemmatimonadetes bacterium]|nr:hypothetical protein [Gemmatimonadota bacterium]